MGYEFKIIKTSNDIEDINISYGLCGILKYNRIPFRLKDNKSMYSIYTEEFDIEELIFDELNPNEIWNINSTSGFSEITGFIVGGKSSLGLNKFISTYLNEIFNYFLTQNIDKTIIKSESSVSIGNCFYSFGVRGGCTPKALSINPVKKYLSYLGWVYSCSYCKNGNIEITAILRPSNTGEINKPFNFSYVDKETGELKINTCLKKSSEVNLMARLYIETLIKYKMLSEEYSDIIFMKNILAGHKPLSDKTEMIPVYKISNKYMDDLLKSLTWSIVSEDVKDITSKYVLNMKKYSYFSKLIRIYSKEQKALINNDFKEEILNMYNERIKKIYNNEVINKLSKGFGRLLRDKKGFDIQAKLYNVTNEKHLFRVIRYIIDTYSRVYISKGNGISIINNEELLSLTQLINNKDDAKICVDAILSIGKVFIVKKEN